MKLMKLWHVVKESCVAGGKDYEPCSFISVIYSSSYNECRKKAKALRVENDYDDINPVYIYPMSDVNFTHTHPYHDNFPDPREPVRKWHLFGSEYAGDDTWFSTHIVSSNDRLEVEMQMDNEGTQGQFKEMVIVHTDELDEEYIEEVLS
jgi:hypothetical protein